MGLLAIFLLSGVSGLVYEVVWLRMLIRVFGITVYAVSTVVVVFMAGLALGSFLGAHIRLARRSPLRTYGLVEIGIGITAVISTLIMPRLPTAFASFAEGSSEAGLLLARLVVSVAVVLPPTLLMGATLPLLSEHLVRRRDAIGPAVGLLYGVNTVGAVLGVVLAGFIAIAAFGEQMSAGLAALLNVACGVAALMLALGEAPPIEQHPDEAPPARVRIDRRLLIAYAVSGLCAIALQVIWARLLILILGVSVYGFSSMLAMYLLGIGIGSVIMARFIDRLVNPLRAFAILEILNAITAVVSLHTYVALGTTETNPEYLYSTLWSMEDFARIPVRAALVVLPTTLVLGAIFPVVTRLCARDPEQARRAVGQLYAFNTLGAIVGSLLTGFVLIPLLGTLTSFLLIATVSLGVGLYLYALDARPKTRAPALAGIAAYVLCVAFALEDPFLQIIRARLPAGYEILAHAEDRDATVTVVESESNRQLYINGMHVSGTGTASRFMSIMGLTFHPDPQRALIIALGVGEAFRGSLDHEVETTVVELVETVRDHFGYYEPNPDRYLQHPKARVVINDGRNFLLTTRERFDLVLIDGSPPLFSSGMVNLYTRELVELVKEHLTPEGVFALWTPIPCFESDFWMIARNFADTFNHVRVWTAPGFEGTFLLGTPASEPIFDVSEAEIVERLKSRPIPLEPPEAWARHISAGRVLTEAEIRNYASHFPAVTDDRPYTEFPLFRFARGDTYFRDKSFILRAAGLR